MVSGTRDNPPLETTLSSVYMWKRFHYRPNQSWPCIIIHNHILLSSSFPGSFDNSGFCEVNFHLRPHLYWSRLPETTLSRGYPGRVNFSLFRCKIQTSVYMDVPELFRGARQLGWTRCLTSAGRATLPGGTGSVLLRGIHVIFPIYVKESFRESCHMPCHKLIPLLTLTVPCYKRNMIT